MKIKSILKILVVTIMVLLVIGSFSMASAVTASSKIKIASGSSSSMSLDGMASQIKEFEKKGENGQKITAKEAIEAFLPIGRILVAFATIVLVVVGLIIGVKYMISGANEKAQMKEKLIYYIIAVVLVYGATGIFSLVIAVMNKIL